jgi:N-acetylglucosaminyldiphosphoundecaprenol N-acetyl-beta-D-mannosaminyltransferase
MKPMGDETTGMRSSKVAGGQVGRCMVLGLPVDVVDMEGAVERVVCWVEAGRREVEQGQSLERVGGGRTACQVVTLNPEMVMAAQRDGELREAILRAELVVADGAGVVWAARLGGASLPGRVTGVDLLDACARVAAERGYRLFLLGAAEGVARQAAERLEARYPGLRIAGTFAGSPAAAEQGEICVRIREAGADMVFVAYGAPAQERWIARTRGDLGAAVAIGVGGAFDFVAGRVPRAPLWMRRLGLEWLYRLWREPWRWRRMLALPRFAVAVARAEWPRVWRALLRRRAEHTREIE